MPFQPRIRLYGKRSSEGKIVEEIHNLLTGNSSRPYPLSAAEIAKVLGISRKTVYNYLQKIPQLQRVKSGHYELPKDPDTVFRFFNKNHKITSDPLVTEWMEDLLTRKHGFPLACWKSRVCSLEVVCNTCQVMPKELLVSQKNTEKIMRNFARAYQNGETMKHPEGKKPQGQGTAVYMRVQAIRDFCAFYDMVWKKGTTGIMSQKVPGHGKYADIRFSQKEFELADQFIKEKWGLDSNIYRWFWIGVESCARFSALYNMSNEYTIHYTQSGKQIYLLTAYETKTQHIRGGRWNKFITRQDTQKSIDLLRSRGVSKIYESKVGLYRFQSEINKKLAEIYNHVGKAGNYFLLHPTHVLRHLGAHYWLSKTNYNYGIIAEVGGWNTIDELKKSYGQIPPEKILEIIT